MPRSQLFRTCSKCLQDLLLASFDSIPTGIRCAKIRALRSCARTNSCESWQTLRRAEATHRSRRESHPTPLALSGIDDSTCRLYERFVAMNEFFQRLKQRKLVQ